MEVLPLGSQKLPKGVIYVVEIKGWEPSHIVSIKSPFSDSPGYYESSSIRIFGSLAQPEDIGPQKAEVLFIEDTMGELPHRKNTVEDVGYIQFKKRTGLLEFTFFISTAFFNRISLSLVSGKIDRFLAYGEKLKRGYGNVFEFRLRAL